MKLAKWWISTTSGQKVYASTHASLLLSPVLQRRSELQTEVAAQNQNPAVMDKHWKWEINIVVENC